MPGETLDDVVNESYLLARRANDRWAAGDAPADIDALLFVSVRTFNDMRDRFRTLQRQSRHFVPCREADLDAAPAPDPLGGMENALARADLRTAIKDLPRKQREAVDAIYFRGLTQLQYARESGTTQPAVSHLIKRAFKNLRSTLSAGYTTEESP